MPENRIPKLPLMRVLIPLTTGIWIQHLMAVQDWVCILVLLTGLAMLVWQLPAGRREKQVKGQWWQVWRRLRPQRRMRGLSPFAPWYALIILPVCLAAGMLLNIAPDIPACPDGFYLARISSGVEPRLRTQAVIPAAGSLTAGCSAPPAENPAAGSLPDGCIASPTQPRPRTLRCQVDRIFLQRDGEWVPLRGKASLSLQSHVNTSHGQYCTVMDPPPALHDPVLMPENEVSPPQCGQWILFRTRLQPYPVPLNPRQFDYGRLQKGRGIYYQAWIPAVQWRLAELAESGGLRISAVRMQTRMLLRLGDRIHDPEAMAILGSLLLGYRKGMDTATRETFARSGVMHILAVSGLHVGILYLLPSLLVRPLRSGSPASWMAWCMILLLLWGYAFLTGLSASVVRAVAMCSLHRIALLLGRHVPSLHILSLAALIMILARPALLLEAGFQLSFAAVAGILLLYPLIQQRLHILFPARAGKPLRGMLAVSLAAQLATAPLAVYHFNQFSLGALPANFLVIPLAAVMLYGGFLFFCCGWSVCLSTMLGWMLEGTARLLLGFIEIIAELPGILIETCSLHPLQVVLLYLAGLAAVLHIHRRQWVTVMLFLTGLALCLVFSLIRTRRRETQQQVQVYALPHESAIGFLEGSSLWFHQPGLAGSSIEPTRAPGSSMQIPFELQGLAGRYRMADIEQAGDRVFFRKIDTCGLRMEYLVFGTCRLLLVSDWPARPFPVSDIHFDVMVVRNNALPDTEFLSGVPPGMTLITDGSNSPWTRHEAAEIAGRYGIEFHDVMLDGCFLSDARTTRKK